VEEIVNALPVTHVLVACNAASVVLPDIETGTPIRGMIRHGVQAALDTGLQRWGVIGGKGTIAAGIYGTALSEHGLEVIERSAQALSAHVEAGRLAGDAVESDVSEILSPLQGVEGLLLACTHYSALMRHFQRVLPDTRIVDPVETLVTALIEEWALDSWEGAGAIEAQTTGDEVAMRNHALQAFGFEW
jgi:glutamate racemase